MMHWVDKAKGVKEYIPEATKVTEKDATAGQVSVHNTGQLRVP